MNLNNNKISLACIKYEWIILTVIVILGLAIRLYGINSPLVDSHQGRQTLTAMMTRNLYEDNMNIFSTRLDIFGNRPGHIIMEFPLMHSITALLYYLFGVHDTIGRLVSVAFSVGAMFLIYGLARKFLSVIGAFAAFVLYAFSPMNIYFSRAFMPESSMMFFTVGSVYFILRYLENESFKLYLIATLFAALVCLAKPTAGTVFIPIIAAWFLKHNWTLLKRFDFWLYMVLATVPFILWFTYAHNFNSINPCPFGYGDSWIEQVRIRGITEHWLSPRFYTFVGGSIILLLLTPLGFIGAVTGVPFVETRAKRILLYSWLGAIIVHFYGLAGPNSGHIYYHLLLLPLAVIFFGFSVEWLLSKQKPIKQMLNNKVILWLGISFVIIAFAGYTVGYYKYFKYMYSDRMPYVLEVSNIIKKHTPRKRFVIENESGLLTSVISYYSHSRAQGFTVSESAIEDLESLRSQGATTFVSMKTKYGNNVKSIKGKKWFWNYLNEKYKPIAINDNYHMFDLTTQIKEKSKKNHE